MKARVDPKEDVRFWQNTADALGISTSTLQQEFLRFPSPLLEVIELVRRLEPHYQMAMLSNQIESWHSTLMTRWDLWALFDPIVTSYAEGVAKPDPEIYQRLLQKLDVPAEQCLFIDDIERNLLPAQQLGMKTILFTSDLNLERAIEAIVTT